MRVWAIALAALLGMIGGILILALFVADSIYDYEDTIRPGEYTPVDVIVVLSGGKGRIRAATNFWYERKSSTETVVPAPYFYVSGMGRKANWEVFAKQVRPEVLLAMDRSRVILETKSSNTEQNAYLLLRYARKNHWKNMILVTSSYHMRRAKFIFEKVMNQGKRGPERPYLVDTFTVLQRPFRANEWRRDSYSLKITVHEFFKWVYYWAFWKPLSIEEIEQARFKVELR